MSYYRMFDRHVNLSFKHTIETRPHGDRQAHHVLTSRHTRSPHHLQRQQQLRAQGFCNASYGTGNPEKGRFTSGSIHFISGDASTSVLTFSATATGALLLFIVGQGSYSSRSKHLTVRFLGLQDWIMDEKLVIDHVSTKDSRAASTFRGGFLDGKANISTDLPFLTSLFCFPFSSD